MCPVHGSRCPAIQTRSCGESLVKDMVTGHWGGGLVTGGHWVAGHGSLELPWPVAKWWEDDITCFMCLTASLIQNLNQNNLYSTHVVAVQTKYYCTVLNMEIVYENMKNPVTVPVMSCQFSCKLGFVSSCIFTPGNGNS